MARPGKITPAKIARVRADRAAGKGLRAAAKSAGVSHETVRQWEHRSKKRGRPLSSPAPKQEDVDAVLAAPQPEGLEGVRARRAVVTGLLSRLTDAVVAEEFPPTSYVTLAKYADDLDRLIAEMTPPVPKDPNEDPNVRESERILVARIEGMVLEAERARAAGAGA